MRHALPASDPPPVTVIGVGSPWGDDRIGWCVIDALAARPRAIRARLLKLDRPGPALLEEIAGRQQALLVDAAATGAPAGTLQSIPGDALSPASVGASTHRLGVAEALALGWSLRLLPAELRLYLVSIDPRGLGTTTTGLTPAVAAAIDPLVAIICRRLCALRTPLSP
jgi:hydrogenase maturation protease